MAQINVNPLVLKDVVLSIGTDSYENHVSQVLINPSNSQISWNGMTPSAAFTDATPATWTCQLTYVQDWETTNSLSEYLRANAGVDKVITFKPRRGSGPSFTITATIVAGPIGGTGRSYAEATVTLPVKGEPTKVPAGA